LLRAGTFGDGGADQSRLAGGGQKCWLVGEVEAAEAGSSGDCDDASTDLPAGPSTSRDGEDLCNSADRSGLRLWAAGCKLGKRRSRCEDAFCIDGNCVAVADGVGSLARLGLPEVDSAAYASELAAGAVAHLGSPPADEGTSTSSREEPASEALLREAVAAAERGVRASYGASTLTLAALSGAVLSAGSLGDSGLLVVRGLVTAAGAAPNVAGEEAEGPMVVFKTNPQQHGWNWPFQLARLPPSLLGTSPEKSDYQVNTAADCDTYQVCVYPGDLVLVFTDGFSDNLYEDEIIDIVRGQVTEAASLGASSGRCRVVVVDEEEEEDLQVGLRRPLESPMGNCLPTPEAVAGALAREAKGRSRDLMARTPFNDAAVEHGYTLLGGKPDDVTVVAAWVLPEF